ncbi:MAG: hypothetical protein GY798_05445 [Hyphomicrobiales bacterium]|nr:hypothetical protein [Hyphomicrobiales bacterium]
MRARERVHQLLITPDALVSGRDLLPTILYLTNCGYSIAVARREHVGLETALLEDISWDGTPMPDM